MHIGTSCRTIWMDMALRNALGNTHWYESSSSSFPLTFSTVFWYKMIRTNTWVLTDFPILSDLLYFLYPDLFHGIVTWKTKQINMLRLRTGYIPKRATRNAAFPIHCSLITQVRLHLPHLNRCNCIFIIYPREHCNSFFFNCTSITIASVPMDSTVAGFCHMSCHIPKY